MTLKQVLATISTGAIITGGLVVGFSKPKPLTYDEYQALIDVYNYEIAQRGGNIVLGDPGYPVTADNLIPKLNATFLKRPQDVNVTIKGQTLTPSEYQLLRSGLFKKAEQKSLIEEVLNQ